MADVNSCLIRSGISVQIRRTDGRTHPAIVANVNNVMKSVTVEWFERGETKGKEIDFATIYALNANLLPSNINNQTINPTELDKVTATSSWDEEDEDDEDDVDEDEDEDDAEESRQDELTTADSHNGNLKHSATIITATGGVGGTSTSTVTTSAQSSTQSSLSIRSLPNPRTHTSRTSVIALASQSRLSRGQVRVNNTNGFGCGSGVGGGSQPSSANSRGVENIPPPAPAVPHQNITRNNRGSASSEATAAARKKANVVKEVEKLKKNREERRQKQAEKKEEKEALMNIDPGNPQWEFLAMIREYQASIDMRPLKETDPVDTHQITVCVRKRPLNKKEMAKKEVDVITVPRKDRIVVHEPKNKVDLTKYLDNQQFRFDYVFDETCSNELVYKYTAKPLVKTLFEGGMATCFAYGQTGSGKTHTMGGTFTGKTQNCKKGIYAMVAKDVFNLLQSPIYKNQNLVVSASFFEIYSGKVFDLLADKAKLRVLEDGKQQVQIIGLTEKVVSTVKEVLELIQAGNLARTSGQTSANSNSSRSHAVFQIVLRTSGLQKVFGKFSLIDLAGNERGADTSSANRLTRMEGAEINKSLLALKECIRALGKRGAHLPFRASKLTQVLRDSFICDNTKTCMIAMISPGMSSCEHSLNTLRYADRVKELATTGLLQEINNDDELEPRSDHLYEPDDTRQDDLAALRSLNESEISADLYNFHEAVSQLQQTEEDMLDSLKTWREIDARLRRTEDHLLSLTRDVDYDQDTFASQIDEVVKERLRCLENVQDKIAAFKNQLVKEEVLSRKMNPNSIN